MRSGYQYESVLNSGDVSRTTKRTDLTNQLSNWNAGNISMNAGHDITLQGVNLNGANVSLAAGHNLSAIEVYDIKENVDINSNVSMFRQRVSIDINSERTAIGNSIGNGSGVVTRTAGNNILDRGTTIAGIAQSTIAGNRVSEEAIKSTIHQERTRTTGGAFWVSTQSQGSTQETLQMTNIFVPSNASRFQGGGGVSVQLPKGSDLRAQIDRLKGQPGNEYLGQLAERSDIDWQEVEVINKTWNYKKETMGPATAIIVAIGVSLLTGGVGGMASSFWGTVSTTLGLTGTSASVVSAAASAGFSSLASMTATAVINNGGDLGAALEELGSSANVKSLLVSMVTAGAIQGISGNIQVELLNDEGMKVTKKLSEATLQNATFAQLLGKNMVSAIASATISSAVNGGSLEDSLKASLISAFIDTAAANGANWIGDVTQDGKLSQTLAENFANKLMHGVLGCAIGAAKANSEAGCASGAIGGVVGHLTADAVKDLKLKDSEVLALGQITSVLAATLAQKDLNIANSTAQNAILNNRQLHPNEDQLIRANAARYAESKGISLEKALAELTQQALRNVDGAHKTRLGADNNDAQAFLNTLGQGKTFIDKQTGQAYQLFAADEATRNNHAMFGQYTKTPAMEKLLDRAYAAVTLLPKDAQTIQGWNGSFKGSLTGSDLALNDAARDTTNMWKQPPVVQWAVLGHIRQERSENMQGQIDLMDELRKLNASGVSSPAVVERKSQIINDLTNLEHENQVLLGAARVHILGMGQNGLLSPINQRESFEGFGAARAAGGVNFRGMSSASINARIAELKFAKATAAAEAKAIDISPNPNSPVYKQSPNNIAQYQELKLDLKATQAANEVVESLKTTGQLPSNYVNKEVAKSHGWSQGRALNNHVKGGQIGGDIYENNTGILPSAPGRVWYEVDVGLDNTMARSNRSQQGARLLYSSDGLLFVSPDHYKSVIPIGKWKQ